MANFAMQRQAVAILVVMNTAITNLRLYPLSSPMVVNSLDRLELAFLMFFEQETSLVIAESEKNILINGDALSKADQDKLQVKAFLELMLNFEIRSVTFEKGLDKTELLAFLGIMAKKPEEIKSEGGLRKLIDGVNLPHIFLDKKVYIAKDEESQIIAGLDIKDDDILQFALAAHPELNLEPGQIKELMKDSDWISQVLRRGMNQVMQQPGGPMNDVRLPESVLRMFAILEKASDKADQERISSLIAKAISELDVDVISLMFTQNIEGLFDGKIYEHVIEQIDSDKFEKVVEKIEACSLESDEPQEGVESALCRLMTSGKGEKLQRKREELESAKKSEKEMRLQKIEGQLRPILAGDETSFLNRQMMSSLPDIASQLHADEEHEKIDRLVKSLADGLQSPNPDVRREASAALVKILDLLPAERQTAIVQELTDPFVKWIELETSATSAYENICLRLKEQLKKNIYKKQFSDCVSVLNIFHLISSGQVDKNDTAHSIASNIIRELATPGVLELLLDEFSRGEDSARDDAGRMLGRLGDTALNHMLDLLKDHDDSNERVRIMHVFAEIGRPSLPVIRERLLSGEPWYFLRNLAYMLGHINCVLDAHILEPLLLNRNVRVRLEALKSLSRAGDSGKGPLLLSALETVDEEFKPDIVEVLGKLKYLPAVSALVELLKTRPLLASASRIDLEERICIALGRMGSREAIAALTEISKPKGLFSRKVYPEKVISAATKALASIRSAS